MRKSKASLAQQLWLSKTLFSPTSEVRVSSSSLFLPVLHREELLMLAAHSSSGGHASRGGSLPVEGTTTVEVHRAREEAHWWS